MELTRRDMLKGSAVLAAGLAATAGLTGLTGCASGEPAAQDGITWDHEADVVVLGCGSAGIGAACETVAAGGSVLVLEKQSDATYGGSSRISGGYIQRYTPEFVSDQAFGMYPEGRLDPYCAEAEAVTAEWLDLGLEAMEMGNGDYVVMGNGPAAFAVMEQQLQESGASVLFETRATELIRNDAGEVIGVTADQAGTAINVKAKKAVVLATGCSIANEELMAEMFYPGVKMINCGAPYNTGDGQIMAMSIGAKPWRMSSLFAMETLGYCAVKASEEVGAGVQVNTSLPGMFIVNKEGRRVVKEDGIVAHEKGVSAAFAYSGTWERGYNGVDSYYNRPMYMVFDQKTFDGACVGNADATAGWGIFGTDGKQYHWTEDNRAELEKGWIASAGSIEELAASIGIDAAALAGTVAKFNADCAAGSDEFGRVLSADGAFGDGPFYAIEVDMGVIYTLWGPKFDEAGRVLNWKDEVIPRLYVAGDCSQGVFQNPCYGIHGSMASGRLAARDAAVLTAWDEA